MFCFNISQWFIFERQTKWETLLIKFAAFRGPWLLRPLPKDRKILPTAANNQIGWSSEYHRHEIKEINKIPSMLFHCFFLYFFFQKWSQWVILCMQCQITQGAHMEDTTLLTVNTQSAKIGTLSMTHGGRAYFSYLLIINDNNNYFIYFYDVNMWISCIRNAYWNACVWSLQFLALLSRLEVLIHEIHELV